MDLAQRQEQPLVFPDVERGRKIPDRWQDIHDLPRDPAELAIEAARVIDVLNRVRAQHRVELLVGERQPVDVVHLDEIGYVGMLHDVHVDAAAEAADNMTPPAPGATIREMGEQLYAQRIL